MVQIHHLPQFYDDIYFLIKFILHYYEYLLFGTKSTKLETIMQTNILNVNNYNHIVINMSVVITKILASIFISENFEIKRNSC